MLNAAMIEAKLRDAEVAATGGGVAVTLHHVGVRSRKSASLHPRGDCCLGRASRFG